MAEALPRLFQNSGVVVFPKLAEFAPQFQDILHTDSAIQFVGIANGGGTCYINFVQHQVWVGGRKWGLGGVRYHGCHHFSYGLLL